MSDEACHINYLNNYWTISVKPPHSNLTYSGLALAFLLEPIFQLIGSRHLRAIFSARSTYLV